MLVWCACQTRMVFDRQTWTFTCASGVCPDISEETAAAVRPAQRFSAARATHYGRPFWVADARSWDGMPAWDDVVPQTEAAIAASLPEARVVVTLREGRRQHIVRVGVDVVGSAIGAVLIGLLVGGPWVSISLAALLVASYAVIVDLARSR